MTLEKLLNEFDETDNIQAIHISYDGLCDIHLGKFVNANTFSINPDHYNRPVKRFKITTMYSGSRLNIWL